MSSTPDETTRQAGAIHIDAAHLRPGVQVRLIAAMKLPQLFCDPQRCQVPPRGPSAGAPAAAAPTEIARLAERQALVLIADKAHDGGHASHALSAMTLALLLGKQAGLPQAALHTPKVRVYAPEVPRRQSILVDLSGAEGSAIECALRLQARSGNELDCLLPRRKIHWACLADRS